MKKRCNKCKLNLPIDHYYFYKSWGNYSGTCKECEKADKKQQYIRRKDKILKTVHAYRDANPELIKSRARGKYKNNTEYREYAKSYQIEYRKTHKYEINNYAAEYRARNRDIVNKKRGDYSKTDRGRITERRHDYTRRAAKKNSRLIGTHTYEEWTRVLKRFNYSCAACGSKEGITQDHIIPISKCGSDNIDNIQPLCRSCNSKKHNKFMQFAPKRLRQTVMRLPDAGEYL